MSAATRFRRRPQSERAPASSNAAGNNSTFEEAKAAFLSLTLTEDTERIDEVWQELRRSYDVTVCNGHNHQSFPLWALENLPHSTMSAALRLAYRKKLGELGVYASKISEHFEVSDWYWFLFFNKFEQGRARIVNQLPNTRPKLTFHQLYDEVKQNRSKRLNVPENSEAQFQPSDFRACRSFILK